MDSLKKAAAILCSAAALAVFGAAAFPANAFETVDLDERSAELKTGTVNIIADQVYAEPGEKVDFRVLLSGNTGYANCGIALFYDPALTLDKTGEYHSVMKVGAAASGLMTEDSLNSEDYRIAFSSMGTINCKNDGTLYTVYFTVPEDAQDGAAYPMRLNIIQFLDKEQVEVSHQSVNGWIKVRKPVTTTVTTVTTTSTQPTTTTVTSTTPVPTTSVTTVTTVTSTTTKPPVTTLPPVTTPEPVTETEPPVTTVAPPDTEPPVITTTTTTEPVTEPITQKTTRGITPDNGATTAKGGTKPAVPGVKTGDLNTGAATAGLMLALSTAAALKLRKKDE